MKSPDDEPFIGPRGCRLRHVFIYFYFFCQAKRGAITKFLAESAAIYDSASCYRRPQVRGVGLGWGRVGGGERREEEEGDEMRGGGG